MVVSPGSSVAIGTALLTISVAFGLLAALLSAPELEAPDDPDELELELEPHAARTRAGSSAVATATSARRRRARGALVDLICSV